MTSLNKKAFGGLVFLITLLGLVLFLSAGTFHYPEAWAYLIIFFIASTAITFYLMKNDKALLERRVNAGPALEKQKTQKLIQSIAQVAFLAIFLVSAFDHRFNWSSVPLVAVILGDMLIATGFYIVFAVFKENTFTSATIEVDAEQKVISTGPYSVVRHPMYSGALIMLMATPIALGSWWGMLAFIPIAMVIIWRLLAEEAFLTVNLPGYLDYCTKVHFRIVPGLF